MGFYALVITIACDSRERAYISKALRPLVAALYKKQLLTFRSADGNLRPEGQVNHSNLDGNYESVSTL